MRWRDIFISYNVRQLAKARLPLSLLPSFCPIACYKIGYFFFFEKGGSKINPFENQ